MGRGALEVFSSPRMEDRSSQSCADACLLTCTAHTFTRKRSHTAGCPLASDGPRGHWLSPHSTHPPTPRPQGLVPGQPGTGPTFLALETRSSLEPQTDHGEGLRVRGHCDPGKEGGLEDSARQNLCFLHITPRDSSSGHVTPHSLLPVRLKALPGLASVDQLVIEPSSLFPKGFLAFGILHMFFHCLKCLGIQRRMSVSNFYPVE